MDTHTHTQDCALRKKVFRKLRAVAGLLLIVSRRLRVPVHNKLPIRGQMIVFQLGSVSIGWLYCMCAKRGIRRPYSFALHRPNESQLIPFGSGPFYSHSHTRSLLLVDIETLFSESLHRKRGSRYRKKTTYTSGFEFYHPSLSTNRKGVDRKRTNNRFRVRFRSFTTFVFHSYKHFDQDSHQISKIFLRRPSVTKRLLQCNHLFNSSD